MGAGESGEVILGPSSSQLYANVADAYRRAKVLPQLRTGGCSGSKHPNCNG